MRRLQILGLMGVLAAVSVAGPAMAEVTHVDDAGFAVLHVTQIKAKPEAVWAALIAPQNYWSSAHSWSGDAANLYLDTQAGGCFCERLPATNGAGGSLNSVEHMRVVYSESPRVLRMSGALGPLQSEAVVGTMNIAMEAHEDGTKISLSYVVGGYMRMKPADIAPMVDAVTGEQLLRLKAVAEGRSPSSVVWPPKKSASDDATKMAAPSPKDVLPKTDGAKTDDGDKEPLLPPAKPDAAVSTGRSVVEPSKPAVRPVPKPAPSPASGPPVVPKPSDKPL